METLANMGVTVTPVVTLTQVLTVLSSHGKISADKVKEVQEFVLNNQTVKKEEEVKTKTKFADRINLTSNPVTKRLFEIMMSKQSNVCVAVDSDNSDQLLETVSTIAPHVAVIKLHQDIVKDWSQDTAAKLRSLADTRSFLLFEDRKYADSGNTVQLQAAETVTWADLVTVHGVSGPGVIQAIASAAASVGR